MKLIFKNINSNKTILIDKIKKENIIYFTFNSDHNKIRTTKDKSEGFFDIKNKKFYYNLDSKYNKNNEIFYLDLNYENLIRRDKDYEEYSILGTEFRGVEPGVAQIYSDINLIKKNFKKYNKEIFNSFLEEKTLLWKDNQEYFIDLDTQEELLKTIFIKKNEQELNINNKELKWYSKEKEMENCSLEALIELYKDMKTEVQKYDKKKKEYDDLIYKCQSVEELNAIEFIYE